MARRQFNSASFLLFECVVAIEHERERSMQIDFDKMDGLAPAIVQEGSTGEVLMVGFMNAESYQHTVETGYVTFYSRTRKKLWMTGETSGKRRRLISALTHCDPDIALCRVHAEGDGAVVNTGKTS